MSVSGNSVVAIADYQRTDHLQILSIGSSAVAPYWKFIVVHRLHTNRLISKKKRWVSDSAKDMSTKNRVDQH